MIQDRNDDLVSLENDLEKENPTTQFKPKYNKNRLEYLKDYNTN